jgi:hypothetical protein
MLGIFRVHVDTPGRDPEIRLVAAENAEGAWLLLYESYAEDPLRQAELDEARERGDTTIYGPYDIPGAPGVLPPRPRGPSAP